jgi:CheY-like chemotaxis protein
MIEFGYEVNNNEIIIFVKDTGIGIPEDKKGIIFNSFRQAHESNIRVHQGLGLGLTISKKIIKILNGEIWFESIENRGSTFYIKFPFKQNNTLSKDEKFNYSPLQLDCSDKTILIAEDIESNYLLLEVALKKTKAKILWAKNGKQALDISLMHKVDLILMDINMPLMDGSTAAKLIKESNPNLIIIAQTAFSDMDDTIIAKKYNCDEILYKPISLKNLYDLIRKYL